MRDLPESTLDFPWTISYVIRKNQQLDSFSEVPKDKRPPDTLIWWGSTEEMEDWFDTVFDRKKPAEATFEIDPRDIE